MRKPWTAHFIVALEEINRIQLADMRTLLNKLSIRSKNCQLPVSLLADGFTLIELLVTIAIAAILAGLAAPSFNSMLEANRISVITSQFSGALTYARNEAVTRNKHVVICKVIDASVTSPKCATSGDAWDNGWMVFIDNDGNNEIGGADLLLRIVNAIPKNYSILSKNAAVTWIAFNADGIARFKGGLLGAEFAVTPPAGVSSQRSKDIVVDMTGRTRITD